VALSAKRSRGDEEHFLLLDESDNFLVKRVIDFHILLLVMRFYLAFGGRIRKDVLVISTK